MDVEQLFAGLAGCVSVDSYNTAWVALVPDLNEPNKPQWPQALDFLRATQLSDGGWGAPIIYHPHERTLCTLAAIAAFSYWQQTAVNCPNVQAHINGQPIRKIIVVPQKLVNIVV